MVNTKFFHLSAMVRRQRNLMAAIKIDRGEWLKDPVQIEDHFVTNFKELYFTSNPSFLENLLGLIPSLISEEENQDIIKIPTVEEIKL